MACYGQGDIANNIFPSLYKGLCKNDAGHYFYSIFQVPRIIANVIEILLGVIAVLAVIYITYAGIRYIMSEGDPTKIKDAKSGITNAIIGLVLSGAAYVIVDFVARRFS